MGQSAAEITGFSGPPEHALRRALAAELHARPPRPRRAPLRISHLALLTGEAGAGAERAHLAALCARFGVSPPPDGITHFSAEFDDGDSGWALTWERHTEFSTYTMYCAGSPAAPFADPALARLPGGWRAGLAGELLTAAQLDMLPADAPIPDADTLAALFGGRGVVGGLVAGSRAQVWTDFALDTAGAVRLLVQDRGLTPTQAGRLVQRLLEIETYRMMALLALPLAREVAPKITRMERRLGEVVGAVNRVEGIEGERALLQDLAALAAEVETMAASTPYRFGAGRAYHALCLRRLDELRESRVEGQSTLAEFLDRRLTPAMRTCETMHQRLEALSERVSRAGNLLRTRVDVTLEQQNLALLASMNRRARLQLRLQQMVEGLSVIAITYYAVGLVAYLAQAAAGAGLPVHKDVAVGVALPFVLGLVWWGIRRLKRRLAGDDE